MKKILVVEDEYYARKSIVKILQESDLDIQVCGEAVNGMKAIELLEEYKDIALVITDIQMKKMGGLELASYLHKHRPEIDILILTAFENFDYAREALRYNVKDYIVKPIYKENLLPPVKKVLEKQEEKREAPMFSSELSSWLSPDASCSTLSIYWPTAEV